MRVLVLGADGFIGRHIAFGLRAAGWDVLAHARSASRLRNMGFEVLSADLTAPEVATPEFWAGRTGGVTHVVNSAGLLTGTDAALHAVHIAAPAAIAAALPDAAHVLLSAVGIDDSDTPFARIRRAAERDAAAAGHTILRAGLVVGDTSYGGSSLARALAALPVATPVVGTGSQRFNPVHAADLTRVIDALLRAPRPGAPLQIGGPESVTQAELLAGLRGWMGLRPVPALPLPLPLAQAMGAVGDALRLGPISRTAVTQLEAGVLADTSPDLPPVRGFSEFLAARPAGTQDLWHARLYLLRPLVRFTLIALWLVSGLIGLLLPPAGFLPLLPETSLPDTLLIGLARLGGIADLAIAAALFRNWRPRLMAGAQLALIGAYTLAFTFLAPVLWLLPLGGLLKNLPILVLIAIWAVLEEER